MEYFLGGLSLIIAGVSLYFAAFHNKKLDKTLRKLTGGFIGFLFGSGITTMLLAFDNITDPTMVNWAIIVILMNGAIGFFFGALLS